MKISCVFFVFLFIGFSAANNTELPCTNRTSYYDIFPNPAGDTFFIVNHTLGKKDLSTSVFDDIIRRGPGNNFITRIVIDNFIVVDNFDQWIENLFAALEKINPKYKNNTTNVAKYCIAFEDCVVSEDYLKSLKLSKDITIEFIKERQVISKFVLKRAETLENDWQSKSAHSK